MPRHSEVAILGFRRSALGGMKVGLRITQLSAQCDATVAANAGIDGSTHPRCGSLITAFQARDRGFASSGHAGHERVGCESAPYRNQENPAVPSANQVGDQSSGRSALAGRTPRLW